MDCALPLAAVLTLLEGSHRNEELLDADVITHLSIRNDFRIELALELVDPSTDVHYESATLQAILTDRGVSNWRVI